MVKSIGSLNHSAYLPPDSTLALVFAAVAGAISVMLLVHISPLLVFPNPENSSK